MPLESGIFSLSTRRSRSCVGGTFRDPCRQFPRARGTNKDCSQILQVHGFRDVVFSTEIIANLVSTVVQNAEQALKWLDPTYDGTVDLSDDQILAMAAAKIADRSDHTPTAQNVVKILADSRNSDSLRSWMVGSHDFSSSDPVTEAYRFFDIPDRNAVVDLGVLQAYMDMMITDDPSKADDAPRHFTVMLNYVSGQSAQNDVAPDYENPVGLSNMGNTCYLNCLLQYFYTIKPLREMVLRFDNFKIDLSDPEYQPKKVDSQVISKLHVERTQDCKSHGGFVLQNANYISRERTSKIIP